MTDRELMQQAQKPDELMIWKSRALQAEGIIDKFMENQILNSTTNRNTLSCGCKSPYLGFPSE